MSHTAIATRATLLAVLLAAAPAAAQPVPVPSPLGMVPEEIGPWRLSCVIDRMTDRADCLLRHREPVERAQGPGGASLVLEIQDRGGRLVPMVTARDLSLEGAARGLLAVTGAAQLRFPPHRFFEMPCGLEGRSLVCAPKSEDLARAAEELPAAATALVRVTGFGGATAQADPVELRLDRARDAMARFRVRVPEGSAPTAQPSGLTLPEILLRLQRLFN
jgi:hypothetical protein